MSCLTLLTDFGHRDPYVGVMKGQIYKSCPQATVIDLTHMVPPQDLTAAAFLLVKNYRWFPPGTVHLVVVDPGVGSARKAVAAKIGGHYFVAPDNGVLHWVLEQGKLEGAVALPVPERASSTFHGRDLFAPAAARLAAGQALGQLGSELQELKRFSEVPEPTRVVWIDHFGNLVTRVERTEALAAVTLDGIRLPLVRTYAEVEPGQPLALWGSDEQLEISVRDGSAADFFKERQVRLLFE